jgi:hypothetical protein
VFVYFLGDYVKSKRSAREELDSCHLMIVGN